MSAVQPPVEVSGVDGLAWPNPPLAGFANTCPLGDALACEIVGLNNQRVTGRLTGFVPDEKTIHVQLNQVRRPTALRFDQFRMLTLLQPIAIPQPLQAQWQATALAEARALQISWTDGTAMAAESLGQVEKPFGVFLFLPAGGWSTVARAFVPASSFKQLSLAAPGVPVPTLPDLEFEEIIAVEVTEPRQLIKQLADQSRMPMVRIGQALTSLGLITDEQLRAGLAQQQLDRSVPLGETLVRMGIVTRADLQVALARKMGYPLVDLQVFPIAADALGKVKHDVARRLQVAPLMVHDGRLIVALDDPANRHAAIDEVEFIAQMKVVGTIGKCRDLNARALQGLREDRCRGQRGGARRRPVQAARVRPHGHQRTAGNAREGRPHHHRR